jgi:hypothetical protein
MGARGYSGYTPPPQGEGVFASSDQAEGPLSQLTFSLSCEPPSAAGARAQADLGIGSPCNQTECRANNETRSL